MNIKMSNPKGNAQSLPIKEKFEPKIDGQVEWNITCAAANLGVSRPTIYQMIEDGRLLSKDVSGTTIVIGTP
jgi:excisionase family DNA binding protein